MSTQENVLFKINLVVLKHKDYYAAMDAYNDLAWYVLSARCSGTQVRELGKLSDRKVTKLLNQMIQSGGSTDDHIAALKAFMKWKDAA